MFKTIIDAETGESVDVKMTPEEEAEHIACFAVSPIQALLKQIAAVEASITPRMVRDAALGRDSRRLLEREETLDALRAHLSALSVKKSV